MMMLASSLLIFSILAAPGKLNRNAMEFGVRADGIVDDSAAMQTAVNYAVANGVELILPAGNINLGTTSLLLNSPINGSANGSLVQMTGSDGRDRSLNSTTFVFSRNGRDMLAVNSNTPT